MSQSNEDGVNNGEEEEGSGSDDDSDDDGIKVTIDKDKIEAAKSSYQNMQVCILVCDIKLFKKTTLAFS